MKIIFILFHILIYKIGKKWPKGPMKWAGTKSFRWLRKNWGMFAWECRPPGVPDE